MSEQISTRTTNGWKIFDYLSYGGLALALGVMALVGGLASDGEAAKYVLIAGYVVAGIGGLVLQVGLIAKAIKVGMAESS